jgi:hypothetical protein
MVFWDRDLLCAGVENPKSASVTKRNGAGSKHRTYMSSVAVKQRTSTTGGRGQTRQGYNRGAFKPPGHLRG